MTDLYFGEFILISTVILLLITLISSRFLINKQRLNYRMVGFKGAVDSIKDCIDSLMIQFPEYTDNLTLIKSLVLNVERDILLSRMKGLNQQILLRVTESISDLEDSLILMYKFNNFSDLETGSLYNKFKELLIT